MSEKALQIAEKRRDMKGKGEKERYTHLNSEFQIIARRDKKAFLSNQCKEIEENNRMGKTRVLFKKIRDTKGTFHANMGSIKDRNYMDILKVVSLPVFTVEMRNRFKGTDLIDRVPDQLWTEVHDIVQEKGIKTIPKKKKCKNAKWLSVEALQIAEKGKK